jgi:hypothetical protein
MDSLRRCRSARWLILGLATIAFAVLPPLRTACACISCGTSHASACCSPKADGTKSCCSQPKPVASCCSTEACATPAASGCECTAVPASREPAPLPTQDSAAKDVTAATTLHADWQLPAIVPVVVDGCRESAFGPPPRPTSLQIAFCVWRN